MFPLQELEEQLAEQKKLLQSVASRGEEILIQQASPSSARYSLCNYMYINTVETEVYIIHSCFCNSAALQRHFHLQLWLRGTLRLDGSR